MPRVSVVIPTYNYGHFLGEAIQSVLDQTIQCFEIIIVDDGSTDNTREVVKTYKDNRIHYLWQENHGVAAAQNTGIKASTGEYVTILGADDTYLPQNLELKVGLLDSQPEIDLVCSDAYFVYDNNQSTTDTLWNKKQFKYTGSPVEAARQPLKELLFRSCFIMPQATMLRRRVFEIIGYFDESLPTHEDWDFMVRVVQHFSVEAIDIPLLKIRHHGTNLTQNQEKVYQGAINAINKTMRSGSFIGEELKILKQRLALEHFRYGRWALLYGKNAVARKALIAGIKLDPLVLKSYFYFAFSLSGSRVFLALRNRRKSVNHRQIQSHSTGDASL
jgi:glycosyltransferase involved in cell wall biosynthesis